MKKFEIIHVGYARTSLIFPVPPPQKKKKERRENQKLLENTNSRFHSIISLHICTVGIARFQNIIIQDLNKIERKCRRNRQLRIQR